MVTLRSRSNAPVRFAQLTQQHQQRSPNGRRVSIKSLRKKRPLSWMVMLLFFVLVAYLVLVLSLSKQNGIDKSSSIFFRKYVQFTPTLDSFGAVEGSRSIADGSRIAGTDVQKSNEKGTEKRSEKAGFRMKRADNPFGIGVEPKVLLKHKITQESPRRIDSTEKKEHPTPDNILTAFLEPFDKEWEKVRPLPLRKVKADQLSTITYPRLDSCRRLPQQFPIDDSPVDRDPFLPWIHDVFPTADGRFIQFVAQNKRRCRTGKNEQHLLQHYAPQAALFQHVPVQRVVPTNTSVTTGLDGTITDSSIRYRLVPYNEADADGVATRFICRFKPSMTETLSVYNFDYDWTSWRKRYKNSVTPEEGGIKYIHSSQLLFRCPVPHEMQEAIRSGASVVNDWASIFVDLIPIRTPPRYGSPSQFLQPRYAVFQDAKGFDPIAAWGTNHILPAIEDAGRWENIPICRPSLMTYEDEDSIIMAQPETKNGTKKHRLVSCLWASAGYTTRGERFAVNDGQRRLLEWITFNELIGFDHFYVYDNTGAFRNDTSLKPIVDLFPGKVTYIPWPAKVCNNNPNNVDSPGERSSQYAAESSCLLRFGPHVDWIGQFDIDEYLIPMGKYTTALQILETLENEDTRILAFPSWRAWPRRAFIAEPTKITDPNLCWNAEPCFDLQIPIETTMLQAYNCDRQKPGQKTETMPAEKQIYQAEYVLEHFVHYSAVTALSVKNREEYEQEGLPWRRYGFPDARQRFANEVSEGLMIHAKAVARQDTAGWERVCHINITNAPKRQRGLCRLGEPWPKSTGESSTRMDKATPEGWMYNCYINDKVEDYYVPRLQEALKEHANVLG